MHLKRTLKKMVNLGVTLMLILPGAKTLELRSTEEHSGLHAEGISGADLVDWLDGLLSAAAFPWRQQNVGCDLRA
jgi:hypothetical protein